MAEEGIHELELLVERGKKEREREGEWQGEAGYGDWRAMRVLSEYLCMNFKQL